MKISKKQYFFGLLIFMILLFNLASYKESIFLKSISPNKENKIVIRNKDPFLFGATPIFITFKKTSLFSFGSVKYETYIGNDGGVLYDDNITVSWIDSNTAIITLKGEEQADEKIKVFFNKDITYEILQN